MNCRKQVGFLTPNENMSTASVQPWPTRHSGAMYGKVPANFSGETSWLLIHTTLDRIFCQRACLLEHALNSAG